MKSAPHPFDKEPAKGSRETIDRELKRQERAASNSDSSKRGGQKPEPVSQEKRER